MKRVCEYEVWSRPGHLLSPNFGKEIQADVWACGVPRDVFLGVSNIPDDSDIAALANMFETGLIEERQFYEFCKVNDLPERRDDQTAAARFVEYVRGCCVAWVHIPEGPNKTDLIDRVERAIEKFDLTVRAV